MLSSTGYRKMLVWDWCSSGSKCVFSLCKALASVLRTKGKHHKSLKVCKCDSEYEFKGGGPSWLDCRALLPSLTTSVSFLGLR